MAFEKNDYPNSAKAFIAEDVERVFTPLGNITNIADISVFSTNALASIPLTHYEWYPTGFYGAFSVSNENGAIVFKMNERLSEKYKNIYDNYGTVSNQFAQLSTLLASIADNSITNRTDEEMVALLYLPEGSTASASSQESRTFFQELHGLDHLTISVLDLWEENVLGETCLMAGSKTAVRDETGLFFSPFLWVFKNGAWRFCHPAIMDTMSR